MCNVCEPFIKRKFRDKKVYVYSIEEHTGSEDRHDEDPSNTILKSHWELSFVGGFSCDRSKAIPDQLEGGFNDFRSVEDFISYCRKFEDHFMPAKQLTPVLGYIDSPRFSRTVGNLEGLAPFWQYASESIRAKEIRSDKGFQGAVENMHRLIDR